MRAAGRLSCDDAEIKCRPMMKFIIASILCLQFAATWRKVGGIPAVHFGPKVEFFGELPDKGSSTRPDGSASFDTDHSSQSVSGKRCSTVDSQDILFCQSLLNNAI